MIVVPRGRRAANLTAADWLGIVRYGDRKGGVSAMSGDKALRASAVWAALRLRADLISTLPVRLFRSSAAGINVDQPLTKMLVAPGGPRQLFTEWMWATQFDLDRFGNVFGVISERDGFGQPSRVDLLPTEKVRVVVENGEISEYKLGTQSWPVDTIWHEKQFVVPGMHVGLSPIMYAAYSLSSYLSAQEFALDWFASGAMPSGVLRNTMQDQLPREVIDGAKTKFKAAVENRDIFVTGKDWEYAMSEVPANTTQFLESMQYGVVDIARFMGVPADIIDGANGKSAITYANITQRNLQLLILNLGPAIIRREAALTAATPAPRTVVLDTDSLLRMDPPTLATTLAAQVMARYLTPDEARAMYNRAPLTVEQKAEFLELFPPKGSAPQLAPDGEPVAPIQGEPPA